MCQGWEGGGGKGSGGCGEGLEADGRVGGGGTLLLPSAQDREPWSLLRTDALTDRPLVLPGPLHCTCAYPPPHRPPTHKPGHKIKLIRST